MVNVSTIEDFLAIRRMKLAEDAQRLNNLLLSLPLSVQIAHDDIQNAICQQTNNKAINSSQSEEEENAFESVNTDESGVLKATKHISPARQDASNRPAMLRYGDYSPNHLHLRLSAQPHLGFGEYDSPKRQEYLRKQLYISDKQHYNQTKHAFKGAMPICYHKAVQTKIQNIKSKLIHYTRATNVENYTAEGGHIGLSPTNLTTIEPCVMHNNRSPILHRLEQRITAAHGNLLKSEMDKPRGILTNRIQTPREKLLSDLKHNYLQPGHLYNGYSSFSDRSEQMERERIKRELYQNELRLQIEEKRRLATMREEQERREQELENKRLEQQLLRMQEEQLRDEQRRNRRDMLRRNSDDFATRKQELQSRYRKHTESESGLGNLRSTSAKLSSHYSPPVSRRGLCPASTSALPYTSYNMSAAGGSSSTHYSDPKTRYNPSRYDTYVRKNILNRMDSINHYVPHETSVSPGYSNYGRSNLASFSRYDSLSRIDSLKQADALHSRLESLSINDSLNRMQRRHSATQQDLSISRRSPKLQRRSSSSRFDDAAALPLPILKAHSPVARELKYSQAVNSTSRYSSSEALRKLEDKWQMPAVVLNQDINSSVEGQTSGSFNRNNFLPLGAMRNQLQREQKRMEDMLRLASSPRSPPKAVEIQTPNIFKQ